MRFVADTNVIISAIIKESTARRILLHPEFEFYIPEFVFVEMDNHSKEIIEKSGLTEDEYHFMVSTLTSKITIIPKAEFAYYLPIAQKEMQNIDENDTSFLALALYLGVGIWSDDGDFKKQNLVKAWNTKEMMELVGK